MQLVAHLFGLVELVLQRLLVLVQLPDVAHQVLQVRLQPLVLCLYLALLALETQCLHCSLLVLHHCVVIFFWSSWFMECTCLLFTFENGVLLMR